MHGAAGTGTCRSTTRPCSRCDAGTASDCRSWSCRRTRQENHVDHTLIDQTSILKFIEDNWGLPPLGNGSFDAEAGPLLNMFDFGRQRDDILLLNHFTGNANRPPTVETPTVTPAAPTTGDTLTASAATGDPDRDVTNPGRADADMLKLSYEWFNGVDPARRVRADARPLGPGQR